jgi:hypothetical protein
MYRLREGLVVQFVRNPRELSDDLEPRRNDTRRPCLVALSYSPSLAAKSPATEERLRERMRNHRAISSYDVQGPLYARSSPCWTRCCTQGNELIAGLLSPMRRSRYSRPPASMTGDPSYRTLFHSNRPVLPTCIKLCQPLRCRS